MNQSIPKNCFSNVSMGDYNVKLRNPRSITLANPWAKSSLKMRQSSHGKPRFKKTIFDTWNPNQFKIKPANVVIPLNPKFPIKKITFDSENFKQNRGIDKWPQKSKENRNFGLKGEESTRLEKLSIEKLKEKRNRATPQGFHQMFVSMAKEFSPSWREQIQRINK